MQPCYGLLVACYSLLMKRVLQRLKVLLLFWLDCEIAVMLVTTQTALRIFDLYDSVLLVS